MPPYTMRQVLTCDHCPKSFTKGGWLTRHIRQQHPAQINPPRPQPTLRSTGPKRKRGRPKKPVPLVVHKSSQRVLHASRQSKKRNTPPPAVINLCTPSPPPTTKARPAKKGPRWATINGQATPGPSRHAHVSSPEITWFNQRPPPLQSPVPAVKGECSSSSRRRPFMTPDSPSVGGDSSSRESSLIQIASRASTADRLSRQQSRQRRRASILKGTHTHFESRDEKDDNDDSLEDEDEDEDEDEESDEEGDGTRIDEEEDQTEPWFLNRPPSRNRRFTSLTQEESTGEDGERSYMAARSLPSRLGSPRSDESFSRTEASPSASKRKRDTWSTIDLSSATGNMHGAAPPPCKRRVLDKASGNSPRHAYRHGRKRRRQGEYLTPRTPVADQNGFGRDSPSQDWDYYSRRQSPLPSHDGYEGPRPASSDAVTDDANAPGFSLAPPIPPRLSLGFDPALISESLHKFLKDAESASKQPPERSLNNAAPSTSQAQRPLPPQPEKPSLVFDPPKTQPDALHHKPPPLPKNTTRRISKSRAFEPPEHAQAAGVSAPRCALSTSISAAPTPGAPAASHYAADPPSPRLSVKEEMLSASTQTDSTANLHRHAARPSTSPSDGSSRKPCVHHVHSPCSVCTCATSNLIVSLLHWAHSAEWFSCECEK